jgi:hypothetical protein
MLLLTIASPVRAASIQWDTPQVIQVQSDVSLDGTLLYAYALGSIGVPSTTFNGVTFAPFEVANNSTLVTVDSVSLSVSAGGRITSTNGGTGSNSAPFSFLLSDYQQLLESGISTKSSDDTLFLSLGGLTIGQTYLVEFWSNDSKNFTLLNQTGSTITSETVYTAENAVTVDNNVLNAKDGVGQWVTATFTADASSQLVSVDSSTPSGNDFSVVNAFELREIPEPSAVFLLLTGVGVVVYLRRCGSWI